MKTIAESQAEGIAESLRVHNPSLFNSFNQVIIGCSFNRDIPNGMLIRNKPIPPDVEKEITAALAQIGKRVDCPASHFNGMPVQALQAAWAYFIAG